MRWPGRYEAHYRHPGTGVVGWHEVRPVKCYLKTGPLVRDPMRYLIRVLPSFDLQMAVEVLNIRGATPKAREALLANAASVRLLESAVWL